MRKGISPLLGMVALIAIVLISAFSFAVTSARAAKSPSPHIFLSRKASTLPGNAHIAAAIAHASTQASATSPLLAYQGGPVMAGTANVYAIFWQPTGNVSANYNSLIKRYFGDVGGSPLYQNLKQYPQADGAFPSNAVLAASWVDTSAYPSNPLLDSDIQGEVTHAQSVNGWTSSSSNIFFVFTEKNEGLCVPATSNSPKACTPDIALPPLPDGTRPNFCAYHSFFGSSNTIYAALPYAASPTFKGGCTPLGSGVAFGPNNDDADLTINVASHEQMEAATDPLINAWITTTDTGAEIGDLCAWTFAPNNPRGGDVLWKSDNYLMQLEWDNAGNGCTLSNDHGTRYYAIKNVHSNLVMDVDHGGVNAGAQVIQWGNKNGANQQWDLVPDSFYYQIVNRNSGLVLDVYNGGINPGANVIQWTNHHGANQEWVLLPDGANDQIVNVNSGLVMDVFNAGLTAGTHVIQWPTHNAVNEQWSFTPIAPYYKIVNRNSNLVMDVFNGGITAGTNVIQWSYKNGLNQMWALAPDGTNNGTAVYQIVNLHSGLVMDVFNGGITQGTNVIQWTNHNGLNQQWMVVPDGNYVQIVNVKSKLVLDVFNGGITQGVNVIQWTNHNGLNQQWSLVPTSE